MYSSSVSPFHAKTGVPEAAMAAAAWSCVEKMLHDLFCEGVSRIFSLAWHVAYDQVTSAPRDVRVSISTAVWIAAVRVSFCD